MQRPAWVAEDLYPFTDHWRSAGGAEVHYVDEGAGTPILMVHGNPTWSFLYREIILALRGEFRCVAIDLPGFGLSRAPAGFDFAPATQALVLADLVAGLDLRDYVLFGQDWGGPIGLAASGREPGRVAGLVLGNTWAWSMGRRPAAHVWAHALGSRPGRLAVEHLNGFVELALRLGTRRTGPPKRVHDHYRAPFATAASRRPVSVLARAVTGASGFLEQEVEPALRALADRPALLPWGTLDPVFPASDRDRLASRLPRARVHPLEGAGHFIQEDAPDEIAAAVRAWWKSA